MEWRMTGQMSVGVVFVESSIAGGPRFPSADRYRIKQEIIDGLSWLASRHPAGNLSWIMDYQYATINVANPASTTDNGYWINPAVAAIRFNGASYAGSGAGIDQYLADLHIANGSDREMLIFVSSYRCNYPGGFTNGYVVTLNNQSDWAGWGIGTVDRITAHETCHVFGTADEYTGTGTPCTGCDGANGIDHIPNGNCGLCARPPQPCIMSTVERRLCGYTQGQIGWADDLFVELTTADELWAGTDDHVELDIGTRTFTLETPNHDDREQGNRDGYALWTGGVAAGELQRVMIRKWHDGTFGEWKLARVRVWHAGALICDQSPNVWLENSHLTWTGCQATAPQPTPLPISSLVVRVTTADVWWAGTNDDVTLRLAGRSWNLDNAWHDDFERGNTDEFTLDPGPGLFLADIHTVTIQKSADGFLGGWDLAGVEIVADGVTIYNNQAINVWLEGSSLIWTGHI